MSATLPLLASQLIRRPLLLSGRSIGGSSCHLCSRRWASGGRRQKPKRGGGSKKVGSAGVKKKLPPKKKPAPPPTSPPPPPPRKDLPKAPHMQTKNIPKDNNDGTIMGFFQHNPLFVAIFVVPTGVMGVLLLFRPQLRPAWMKGGQSQVGGGSGGKTTGGGGDDSGRRSSLINKNIANAPALYESDGRSLKQADGVLVTDKAEEGSADPSKEQKPQSAEEEDVAIVHEISVNDNENATVVVDLISAVGIRPHPSS